MLNDQISRDKLTKRAEQPGTSKIPLRKALLRAWNQAEPEEESQENPEPAATDPETPSSAPGLDPYWFPPDPREPSFMDSQDS